MSFRSGQTSRDALARSCDLLNQANEPVLGIVVNGVVLPPRNRITTVIIRTSPRVIRELASPLNETNEKILGSLLSTMLDGW